MLQLFLIKEKQNALGTYKFSRKRYGSNIEVL